KIGPRPGYCAYKPKPQERPTNTSSRTLERF
ncbi:YkgJ family cysteine cluster protein, partial [Pseudomonas sp. MWU13-2625]